MDKSDKRITSQMPRRASFVWCSLVILVLASSCGPRRGQLSGDVFIVTKAGESVKLGLVEVRAVPYEAAVKSVEAARSDADQKIAKLQPDLERAKQRVEEAKNLVRRREAEYEAANRRFYRNVFAHGALEATTVAGNRKIAALKQLGEAESALAEVETAITSHRLGPVYFARLPEPIASTKTDADGRFQLELDRNTPVALAAYARRQVLDNTEIYYWLVKYSLNDQPQARIFLSNDNLSTSGAKESLILTPE